MERRLFVALCGTAFAELFVVEEKFAGNQCTSGLYGTGLVQPVGRCVANGENQAQQLELLDNGTRLRMNMYRSGYINCSGLPYFSLSEEINLCSGAAGQYSRFRLETWESATTTVYSASSCDDRQIDYQRSVMIGRCMPTGTSSRQWLCNNATAELHLYNYSSSVDCRGDAGILEAAPLDRCEAGQTAAVMATSDSCIGANKAQLSKACSADLPAYLFVVMLWLSLYHRGIF